GKLQLAGSLFYGYQNAEAAARNGRRICQYPEHFGECQGDQRKIGAPETESETEITDDRAQCSTECDGKHPCHPGINAVSRHHDGGTISPYTEKDRMPKRQQPRKATGNIP